MYVVFNIFGAIFLYWLIRVPKNTGKEEAPTGEALALEKTRSHANGAPLEKKETMMSRAGRRMSFGAKQPHHDAIEKQNTQSTHHASRSTEEAGNGGGNPYTAHEIDPRIGNDILEPIPVEKM